MMNRNDFKVWQELCGEEGFVTIRELAWRLNMLPRSVQSIIASVDTPLVEWERAPSAVRLNGTPEEKRLLYEEIGSKWCAVSEECKDAVRSTIQSPSTLMALVEATGFTRYEVQIALDVMHEIECTGKPGHKTYSLRAEA